MDPSKAGVQGNTKGISQQKKQVKGFAGEVVLPDSAVNLQHNQKSKRIMVTAKDEHGKAYKLSYKIVDENTIRIKPPKELIKAAKKAKKEAGRRAKETAKTDSLGSPADSLVSQTDSLALTDTDETSADDDVKDKKATG